MILYLTYNDPPSGVYWGQVTDVVEHLNSLGGPRVRLVAMVSLRNFSATRRAIRQRQPDALVLPMVPRARYWKANAIALAWVCRRLAPTGIIGRGIFATGLALRMRDRGLVRSVCFDGRGAYAAEWEEYGVVDDAQLVAECRPVEAEAILRSDLRIAVSHALMAHWRGRYGYAGDAHVVVPCTVAEAVLPAVAGDRSAMRRSMGWADSDRVLVYSGSTVGWQSLALVEEHVAAMLTADPRLRMLFLGRDVQQVKRLKHLFPGRVEQRWVPHDRMHDMLSACDAGILLREDSVTNRVASPTKFAEYLAAGLPVLISPYLGDLSELLERERLGWVIRRGTSSPHSFPLSTDERQRLIAYAEQHFTKSVHDRSYRHVMEVLARTDLVDPRASGHKSSIPMP